MKNTKLTHNPDSKVADVGNAESSIEQAMLSAQVNPEQQTLDVVKEAQVLVVQQRAQALERTHWIKANKENAHLMLSEGMAVPSIKQDVSTLLECLVTDRNYDLLEGVPMGEWLRLYKVRISRANPHPWEDSTTSKKVQKKARAKRLRWAKDHCSLMARNSDMLNALRCTRTLQGFNQAYSLGELVDGLQAVLIEGIREVQHTHALKRERKIHTHARLYNNGDLMPLHKPAYKVPNEPIPSKLSEGLLHQALAKDRLDCIMRSNVLSAKDYPPNPNMNSSEGKPDKH